MRHSSKKIVTEAKMRHSSKNPEDARQPWAAWLPDGIFSYQNAIFGIF
jgi:hypothetical protein